MNLISREWPECFSPAYVQRLVCVSRLWVAGARGAYARLHLSSVTSTIVKIKSKTVATYLPSIVSNQSIDRHHNVVGELVGGEVRGSDLSWWY